MSQRRVIRRVTLIQIEGYKECVSVSITVLMAVHQTVCLPSLSLVRTFFAYFGNSTRTKDRHERINGRTDVSLLVLSPPLGADIADLLGVVLLLMMNGTKRGAEEGSKYSSSTVIVSLGPLCSRLD